MNRISSQRARWLVAFIVVALVVPLGAIAANEDAKPSAEAAATEEPDPIRPIPVEDVSKSAEASVASIAALRSDVSIDEWLAEAEAEIKADRALIKGRIETVSAALGADPKVRTLDDLGRMLRSLRVPLEVIDQKLGDHLGQLSKARAQVDREAEIWKVTLDGARAAKASEATLARIRSTQREIQKVRDAQLAQRNRILTLRDKLVDPRSSIDGQLKRVQSALDGRLEGMLESEREPVWSPEVRDALRRELGEEWQEALEAHFADAAQYVKQEPRKAGLQLAIFVVLFLGLRALATRVRRREETHEGLEAANQVFEMPTAMAFVATLAFTWEIHPLAPAPFMEIVGSLAIVPTALIVRRLLPEMTPVLIGVVVLFFADRVRGLLITLPTLERLVFDFELLGALIFLGWMVQARRLGIIPAEMLESRSFRIVGFGIRVAAALLAVALLADLIGMGDLSDLLGSATLSSAYFALFVFAVLRVAQGVASYLLLVRPLRLLNGIRNHYADARARIAAFMKVAAWAIYGYRVLDLIGIRTQVLDLIGSIFSAELAVGALSISLGDVAAFVLAIYLSFRLARLIDFVLNEEVFPRVEMARGVPYAISNLVRYSFVVLGFMVALAAAGIEMSKLTVIAGGLGVGIGFGLQNVVNNFVSGLILLFERPLQVGDAVQLANGLWGEIGHIGIRASVIRTFDGAEVIVPNGSLISEQVTNWTLSDQRRRLEVNVGVEYGTDAERVLELLLEVASNHPRVLADPAPLALFIGFGDSSLDFMLRVWIGSFDGGFTVRSELSVAIQTALREAGVSVPFPQRDLHLKTVSADVSARLQDGPVAPRGAAPQGDG